MEALLLEWLKEYGYFILFLWCILEGEMGLLMAGTLVHKGDMSLPMAIFIAGLGGFTGDQIYFYLGRYSKQLIKKKLQRQRRKFALASLMLRKYGWPIIFVQRYLYGLRTIIPMMIGVTKFSAKRYAFINILSAWVWATVTILPAYLVGGQILNIVTFFKQQWYIYLPFLGVVLFALYQYFNYLEQQLLKHRQKRQF